MVMYMLYIKVAKIIRFKYYVNLPYTMAEKNSNDRLVSCRKFYRYCIEGRYQNEGRRDKAGMYAEVAGYFKKHGNLDKFSAKDLGDAVLFLTNGFIQNGEPPKEDTLDFIRKIMREMIRKRRSSGK